MMIEAIRNGEDKRNVENKTLNMIFNGRMMMESKRQMIEISVALASALQYSQND